MTLHLKLHQRPVSNWTDAHIVSGQSTPPFIVANSPAVIRVLYTNVAGDAVEDATGITDILAEVWASPAMKTGGLLIAPAAVQVTTAEPTLNDWNAATGSYYTAEIEMTAEETAAAITVMDAEASNLQGWLEIRGTKDGENILLGSGPLVIHKASTGGTPPDGPDVYYTAAEVDAAIAAGGGGGGGSGTVTSVSVTTANGVSGSVANSTTTPAITLTLGAITPSTVRGLTITTTTGTFTLTNAKTFSVSNTLTLAGTDGSTLNIGTGGTLGTAAFTAATAYGAVSGTLAQFAATTSAELRGVISDETGTGALVFAGGNIGAATGTSLTTSGNISTTAGAITSGTSNASSGLIVFYDAGSLSSVTLGITSPLGDDRVISLPDSDGTLATQEWSTSQFAPAGTYLVASNNLSDVTDVATARGNLVAAGTAAANTFTAQNIFNLAPRVPTTDLASGTALTIGTYYYKAISSDLGPLTFSGTPAEGSTILLHLEVSGTRTVTFPASYRNGEAISTITSLLFPPGLYLMGWQYRNSKWVLSDSLGALYNSATSDPTANDDANDGYVAGKSIWINTSTGRTFICRDSTATSAVWECINREKIAIGIACSDETTALTTGTAKATFRMPFAFTLTEVRATVTTAPTGATLLTVDINESGTSVISTKLTFDAGEKTTVTAATRAVISDSALADDAEITVDIDQVGSTIAGAGLKVWLIGYRSAA